MVRSLGCFGLRPLLWPRPLARVPILERQAQEALNFVGAAEYDNSPMNLVPDISVYTR